MNHCAIQQREEVVVCPKPRRPGLINNGNEPSYRRPMRWHVSHHQEICDAKAGNELLDIILTRGGSSTDQFAAQVASSTPFFSGSPPCRVPNPLIQDGRFGDEKFNPISPRAMQILSDPPRKTNHVHANFGSNPTIRIEGFDCLDRNRRNRSISALA